MGNHWRAVLWLGLLSMRGAATASPDSEASAPKEPHRSWASLVRLEGAFASVGLEVDHAR